MEIEVRKQLRQENCRETNFPVALHLSKALNTSNRKKELQDEPLVALKALELSTVMLSVAVRKKLVFRNLLRFSRPKQLVCTANIFCAWNN